MRLETKLKSRAAIIAVHGFLWPLLIVFIPGIVVTYYSTQALQDSLKAHFPAFADWVKHYSVLNIVLSFVCASVLNAYKGVKSELDQAKAIGPRALAAMLVAIDNVVGHKANRFGNLVKKILQDPSKISGGKVFDEITQPVAQIDALVGATYEIFRDLDPTIDWRVSLIEVKDGHHLLDFVAFHPKDQEPKTLIEDVRSPDSCASRAIEKGWAIVEDFRAESRKPIGKRSFVTADSRKDEDGSMFSYAIWHRPTKKIIYVLSVCADKKGYIKADQKEFYRLIVEEIEKRIGLEYSLRILKHHVKGAVE